MSEQRKTFYKCNPELHKKCAKTYCHLNGGPCMSTTYPEYAALDSAGKPREITKIETESAVYGFIKNATEEELEEMKRQALINKLEEEREP